MKKFLSVALAVIMLLAAVPTAALAVSYIDKIDVSFVAPVKGENAVTDSILVDAKGFKVKEAKWIDADSDVYLTEESAFEKGDYTIEVTFEPEDGYKFKKAENVEVLINGIEADEVEKNEDGTLTASATFTCESGSIINFSSILKLVSNVLNVFKLFFQFIGTLLGL